LNASQLNALELFAPFTILWPLVRGEADTLIVVLVLVALAACLPVECVGKFGLIATAIVWTHYAVLCLDCRE
jgi:hypothetical protein